MEPNPEAFIFGTEEGKYQKRFDDQVKRLFELAGLDYGRDKGLIWYQGRHESISRKAHESKNPLIAQKHARHKKLATTELYMGTEDRQRRLAAAGIYESL